MQENRSQAQPPPMPPSASLLSFAAAAAAIRSKGHGYSTGVPKNDELAQIKQNLRPRCLLNGSVYKNITRNSEQVIGKDL